MTRTKDKIIQDKKTPLMNFEELHKNVLSYADMLNPLDFFLSFFLFNSFVFLLVWLLVDDVKVILVWKSEPIS